MQPFRPILITRQKQKQKRVLTGLTQVFVFVSAKPRPCRLSKMNFFGSQKCLARQKLLVRQKCRCVFVDENSSTKMHLHVPSMQTTSLAVCVSFVYCAVIPDATKDLLFLTKQSNNLVEHASERKSSFAHFSSETRGNQHEIIVFSTTTWPTDLILPPLCLADCSQDSMKQEKTIGAENRCEKCRHREKISWS